MDLPCGIFHENYAQDMAVIRTKTQWAVLASFLILLCAFPYLLSDTLLTIAIVIGITVVSVHGLNILTGYCGQISMGHAAFMAVGGYVSGILCTKFGWSFFAALPFAALSAGLVGLFFGLPSLKINLSSFGSYSNCTVSPVVRTGYLCPAQISAGLSLKQRPVISTW